MTLWGDTPTSAVKPMALVRELFPAVDPLAALRRLARLGHHQIVADIAM